MFWVGRLLQASRPNSLEELFTIYQKTCSSDTLSDRCFTRINKNCDNLLIATVVFLCINKTPIPVVRRRGDPLSSSSDSHLWRNTPAAALCLPGFPVTDFRQRAADSAHTAAIPFGIHTRFSILLLLPNAIGDTQGKFCFIFTLYRVASIAYFVKPHFPTQCMQGYARGRFICFAVSR